MIAPQVSVVIPAYNEQDRIGSAIEAALAQTHSRIEVIDVDDGSGDDTARIVQEHYPQVVYVHQSNAGPGAARNRGAELASGELLAFLDADDRWVPEKLARQIAVMGQRLEREVVGTNALVYDGRHRWFFNNPRRPALIEHTLHDLIWGHEPYPPSILLRTELFREVGGYDVSFRARCEDEELLYRLAGRGHRIVEINEPLHLWLRKAGSLMSKPTPDIGSNYIDAVGRCEAFVGDEEGALLSPSQFSFALGTRICTVSAACFRAGRHELGREYARRLDDLPAPGLTHRLLRRTARSSWLLFGVAANLYQGVYRAMCGYQMWGGVTGALQQAARRYVLRGSSPVADVQVQ